MESSHTFHQTFCKIFPRKLSAKSHRPRPRVCSQRSYPRCRSKQVNTAKVDPPRMWIMFRTDFPVVHIALPHGNYVLNTTVICLNRGGLVVNSAIHSHDLRIAMVCFCHLIQNPFPCLLPPKNSLSFNLIQIQFKLKIPSLFICLFSPCFSPIIPSYEILKHMTQGCITFSYFLRSRYAVSHSEFPPRFQIDQGQPARHWGQEPQWDASKVRWRNPMKAGSKAK